MKICAKCFREKPDIEFSLRRDGKRPYLKSWCKECCREYGRQWARENKDKVAKANKNWKDNNKDRVTRNGKEWYERTRFIRVLQKSSFLAIKRGYKACTSTAEQIEEAFTGFCSICGVPEIECSKRLCLDHCHETGVFRGWLCNNCNTAIGLLKDSSELINKVADYVSKTECIS